MSEPERYDLFISYAEDDRAWVEGFLLDALRAAGVTVHTEAAFELGRPRLLAFEEAVRQSKRTLLVISPAYLADETAGFVELLAQTYGLDTATWPVIPLLLAPLELPARLRMLIALDATDPARRDEEIARLCATLGKPVPPSGAGPPCPYPGMRSFAERDAPFFHGRESEADDLLLRVHAQPDRAHRFIAVIGPSGSGKSSAVFAGLVPALRKSTLFGSDSWTLLSLRPGPTPMKVRTVVLGDSPTAGPLFSELIGEPPSGHQLLIVDQFEELFTVSSQDEVMPFQEALARLAGTPNVFVVLTARADFYELGGLTRCRIPAIPRTAQVC